PFKPPPGGKGDNKTATKPNSEAGAEPANSPQGGQDGGGDKGGQDGGGDKGGQDGGQEGGQGWWDLPDLFGPEDETHQGQ
ncbi:MAG TPA: hypothetical protein EYN66_07910, partial [Myxococcales bacterium]|nr:hypothetical protein [Myxococcales bacterium]